MEKHAFYSLIKHYVVSKIGNHDDAEDLAQDVFLATYCMNKRASNVLKLKAYLFSITRRKIAHYYTQKAVSARFLTEYAKITDKMSYNSYKEDFRGRELIKEIHSIISTLPPKAREAVELRLVRGLNSEEAAQKANCTVDIFYGRFHEGLKILKKKTGQVGNE